MLPRMKRSLPILALLLAAPALAQDEPATPASVIEAAPADDWIAIPPQDLLVMELAPDADGTARQVVIQLMPEPFSQPWVENIRTLAAAHWWDGKSVYRVVDNWVAQWGGGDPELGMDPGPLPDGVVSPAASYDIPDGFMADIDANLDIMREGRGLPADWPSSAYAASEDFYLGWPFASADDGSSWPVHCYASVGVARDLAPDTGTGSELYAVIGHAPRQLDRNIAVVGRVIDGIEQLSTLKRGTGDAGVYETRGEDTPIVSVRLGDEPSTPPAFEYLNTASESFARYAQVSANRSDAFYQVAAGGIDVCNLKVPIREVKE